MGEFRTAALNSSVLMSTADLNQDLDNPRDSKNPERNGLTHHMKRSPALPESELQVFLYPTRCGVR